jgi:hypothetical protein
MPESKSVPMRTLKSGRHRFPWGECSIALCLSSSFITVGAADETLGSFSADICSGVPGEAAAKIGSIYVSNSRVRIETLAAPSGYFLIGAAAAVYVRPSQRIFMDAKQSTVLTQVFVPVNPDDPCAAWRVAAISAGGPSRAWECQLVEVNAAVDLGKREFRVILAGRNLSRRWVDSALHFPVKFFDADGTTITLEHVRIEAQPHDLFTLPPGYRNLDPNALIERIKHSDVWAGP